MRRNTWIMISLVITLIGIAFLIYFFIRPTAQEVYVGMKIIATDDAYRADYTRFTTPLPQTVVDDLCKNLEINKTSANCVSGMVVYGPDFFDEIKEYFRSLPESEKTYDLVQEKLGIYLVRCEEPASDGYYRCKYDIRGDARYPIYFYFTRYGFYYQIIANTGGS